MINYKGQNNLVYPAESIVIGEHIKMLYYAHDLATAARSLLDTDAGSGPQPYQVPSDKTFHMMLLITTNANLAGNVKIYQGDTLDSVTTQKSQIFFPRLPYHTPHYFPLNNVTIASEKYITSLPSGANVRYTTIYGYETTD